MNESMNKRWTVALTTNSHGYIIGIEKDDKVVKRGGNERRKEICI